MGGSVRPGPLPTTHMQGPMRPHSSSKQNANWTWTYSAPIASWLADLQILEKLHSMTKPLAIVICPLVPGYMVSCYLLIEKRCLDELYIAIRQVVWLSTGEDLVIL